MRSSSFHKKKNIIMQLPEIKRELKQKSKRKTGLPAKPVLTLRENHILHQIKQTTKQLNTNNVSRTNAYLDFYQRYPEIQWALLGHMVSRNGGWHMTDLKGDLLTRLLPEKDQEEFFSFLERGNWLIFQDIFPQFLLYQESLKRRKNLFYLLPHLHVSTFMETIWDHFWKYGDRYLLAIAMVVNEQSYLEKRVIQDSHFKHTVLDTIGFKLYDFLGFNHIIFPFYNKEKPGKPEIIGDTLHHFDSLHERILFGKRLYSFLFHDEAILQGALSWAANKRHTGSRSDYWTHLFSPVNESSPDIAYWRRTNHCQLKKDAPRIYSPPLQFAWKNSDHKKAEEGDWFTDWKVIEYLEEETFKGGEIYHDYCKTIEKIEYAIIAKKMFFIKHE